MIELRYETSPYLKREIIDLYVPADNGKYQSCRATAYQQRDGTFNVHDIKLGGDPVHCDCKKTAVIHMLDLVQ